jgi:hypothetical protein
MYRVDCSRYAASRGRCRSFVSQNDATSPMSAPAELRDGVVAVAEEDPLVQVCGALALGPFDRRDLGTESANSSRNRRRSVPR